MIDLGKKAKDEYPMAVEPSNKNSISYPNVHLYDRNLPLSGKDVGKILTVTVKLKVTSVELSTNKKKETKSYGFDLLGIDFGKKSINLKNKTREELDEMEREEYNRLNK
jgi:hypothetical protein